MTFSRRQFFVQFSRSLAVEVMDSATSLGRVLSSSFTAETSSVQQSEIKENRQTWLRPPGALPESEFLSACTRCTECQEACPYESIRRLGPEWGENAGTPVIIPDESPCYLCEGMPCIEACEPLALTLVILNEASMGTAILNETKCYVAQNQPCDYCVKRCPLQEDAITFGTKGIPVVDLKGCVGCGVCAYLCPADAIHIQPSYS